MYFRVNMVSPKRKGNKTMKTRFYLNGKKITKNAAIEMLGKERLNRMIQESKDTFFEDPQIANDYFIGSGMLSIEFC